MGRSEVERRRVYFEQMEDKLPGGSKHPLFQLIKDCLMNDPSKRPSVQQVLTTLEEMKPMITVAYNQGATAAAAVVGVSGVKLEHPVVNLEHLEVHRENHAPPSPTISPMYSILQKSLSMVDPSDDLRLNVQVTEPLPPELIPTIKQSYWKEVAKASVCANQSCKKLLTETDRPHNCNVCGEVFCHSCYRYCQNPRAETYPLFYSVCLKCNSHANTRGMSRARLHEFTRIRGERIGVEELEAKTKTLCERKRSKSKRKAILNEIDRLTKGFAANTRNPSLSGIFSAPLWTRSATWAESDGVNSCSSCAEKFSKFSSKVHCAVGGQVFCAQCTKNRIVLYTTEQRGDVGMWTVVDANTKGNGLTVAPVRDESYPICSRCFVELNIVMNAATSLSLGSKDFIDSFSALHQSVSKLRVTIEAELPTYVDVVSTMVDADNTSKHKHPILTLAKAYRHLTDAFSDLESEYTKDVCPPQSVTQERLLQNLRVAAFTLYMDGLSQFEMTNQHLSKFMPLETLCNREITNLVQSQSQQSHEAMRGVHIVIKQIIVELAAIKEKHQFDRNPLGHNPFDDDHNQFDCSHNNIYDVITEVLLCTEEEFEQFMKVRGEKWEEHQAVVSVFVKEALESGRKFIKDDYVRAHQLHRYVIRQCSRLLEQSDQHLHEKALDREFPKTKKKLRDAHSKLQVLLLQQHK